MKVKRKVNRKRRRRKNKKKGDEEILTGKKSRTA